MTPLATDCYKGGSIALISWDGPGPYAVSFSTRLGGVSEAPFDTLNLGRLSGDDADRVAENRRRLCEHVGAAPEDLSFNRQVHGAQVRKAEPAARGEPGDALWSDVPGRPMMVFTADCLPVAMARADGARPALALAHVGWRGLLDGVVETAAATMGNGFHAVVGPGIGSCCYEVGEEVSEPFRAAFGRDVVCGGKLDLWASTERALRAAGAVRVERVDLCTACRPDLFFSHRRDGARTGRQGAIAFVLE